MDNTELKENLQRIANKDNAAFEDLYKSYSKIIFGIALSILKNEENCNDVVQLVMSKLFTIPKNSFPTSHELTWLYTVTKNEALQFMRKEHSYVPLDDILDIASVTDYVSHAIDMDTYRDMIKSLDDQSKAIVTLKVMAGFSHKEIGKQLHMPTGTVQWKYHMAVHKLRIAITNFVMFVMFGLGGMIYYINKPRQGSSSSMPEGVPGGINVPQIDFILLLLIILALSALIISLVFFIKYFKKRQQNRQRNVSK